MDLLSFFPAWVLTHGAALIVVLPLMAGAAMAIVPRERMAWMISLLVMLICAATAFGLLLSTLSQGVITYKMGGWDPPHGIEYVVDGLSAPVLLLISVMALLCLFYALPSVQAEVEPKKRAPF